MLTDPVAGQRAGSALDQLGWEPENEAERIRRELGWWRYRHAATEPDTMELLREDLQSGRGRLPENAAVWLGRLADDEQLGALETWLLEHGNERLALAYLHSGNERMAHSARKWAELHGVRLPEGASPALSPGGPVYLPDRWDIVDEIYYMDTAFYAGPMYDQRP
jgi:hypothetical protein